MNREAGDTYHPSGRVDRRRVLVGLLAGLAMLLPASWAYQWALDRVQFDSPVRWILTLVALPPAIVLVGMVAGVATATVGHVRSKHAAVALAAALALPTIAASFVWARERTSHVLFERYHAQTQDIRRRLDRIDRGVSDYIEGQFTRSRPRDMFEANARELARLTTPTRRGRPLSQSYREDPETARLFASPASVREQLDPVEFLKLRAQCGAFRSWEPTGVSRMVLWAFEFLFAVGLLTYAIRRQVSAPYSEVAQRWMKMTPIKIDGVDGAGFDEQIRGVDAPTMGALEYRAGADSLWFVVFADPDDPDAYMSADRVVTLPGGRHAARPVIKLRQIPRGAAERLFADLRAWKAPSSMERMPDDVVRLEKEFARLRATAFTVAIVSVVWLGYAGSAWGQLSSSPFGAILLWGGIGLALIGVLVLSIKGARLRRRIGAASAKRADRR